MRLKFAYDPSGLSYTVNKIIGLFDTFQEGSTAKKHMTIMDAAVNEALRPFIRPGGGIDWKLFGQVTLGAIYFRSFADEVQDLARPGIREVELKSFTHAPILLGGLY